jgi:hypothetical protein
MTPPNEVVTVNTRVPLWVWVWLLLLTLAVIGAGLYIRSLVNYKRDSYVWNTQMRRWAAHYYYCDSAHRDDAKCAQWSDHIPPPPPPPK